MPPAIDDADPFRTGDAARTSMGEPET